MKRRKVLSILLLALITAFIAVSCSGNIEAPASSAEELSYVTFGNGHSRELGTSYWTEDYDKLYWFYTATKTDAYGTTGSEGLTDGVPTAAVSKSGDNPARGLSGRVGPFSQGSWTFKLYAYAEAVNTEGAGLRTPNMYNLIYASDDVSVTLKGGEVKNIPVSVTPQGDVGYVKFNNAYFEWAGASGDAIPKMKITLTPSSGSSITTEITLNAKSDNKLNITNGTSIGTSVPVGYYTANVIVYLNQAGSTTSVEIDNEDTPIFSQTFGLRVYGNAITYITGNMTEGVDSYVTFDVAEQTMKVFTVDKTENTEVKSAITSLNGNKESAGVKNTEDYTTVTFPVGVLDSSSVHQLDVKVTPTASAEDKFQISGTESGKAAVAGLDLSLTKIIKQSDGSTVQESVTSFDEDVIITTYIATNLENVSVLYRNYETNRDDLIVALTGTEAEGAVPSYDKTTGKLIFKTNHFSEYYVKADAEAMNTTTGMVYSTFADAVDRAGNGQEVKLLKDVSISRLIISEKKISIDLAGYSIEESETANVGSGLILVYNNGNLTINDSSEEKTGKIDVSTDRKWLDKNGNETEYPAVWACIAVYPNNGKQASLTINGGEFIAPFYAITGNGTDVDPNSTMITINGGKFNATNGYAIYHPQNGTLTINNGTFEGQDCAIEIRSGNLYIENGSFTSKATKYSCSANGSGTTTSGAAIAIAQHTTKKDISVEINGGTFTGVKALNESNPQVNDPKPQVILSVTGGTFNGDISVADASEFITGGTFSTDPTKYVAEMYWASPLSSGGYKVEKATNWIQIADTSWYDSTKTEFSISSAEQLAGLAKLVNTGNNFSEKTIKLASDIVLSGLNWTPIGGSGKRFSGTFDGLDHTISSMKAVNNVDYGNGFFGDTSGATIKNISFERAFVSRYSSLAYSGNVYGIVAGYAYGETLFENVHVSDSRISGYGKVGAILGMAADPGDLKTTFINCSVSNVDMYGVYDVGGLAGLVLNKLNVQGEIIVDNLNWIKSPSERYKELVNAYAKEDEEYPSGKVCFLSGKAVNGCYWISSQYLYGGFAKYAVIYGTSAHDCTLQSPYSSFKLANMERVIDDLNQLNTLNNPWQ